MQISLFSLIHIHSLEVDLISSVLVVKVVTLCCLVLFLVLVFSLAGFSGCVGNEETPALTDRGTALRHGHCGTDRPTNPETPALSDFGTALRHGPPPRPRNICSRGLRHGHGGTDRPEDPETVALTD